MRPNGQGSSARDSLISPQPLGRVSFLSNGKIDDVVLLYSRVSRSSSYQFGDKFSRDQDFKGGSLMKRDFCAALEILLFALFL